MASSPQKAATANNNKSTFVSHLGAVDKYRLEWNDLSTVCEDPQLRHLRRIACAGHLKVAKFRSVCWSVLLGVLRGHRRHWLLQRRQQRQHYADIKHRWHTNPHQQANDDPLSQSQASAWNQHFCDQELLAVIRQDVVRTFPGVDFYRRPNIQELMVSVLFVFAREFPALCYRQGMHEILAPVLFVMHCDQQTLMHISDLNRDSGSDVDATDDAVLQEILDPKHMEEDAYFVFVKIMASIETFYHIRDMQPMASGHFPIVQQPIVSKGSSNGPDKTDDRSKIEVVGQLNGIRDRILARFDPQLHAHLLKLDIPLTLFGIRWLRLLFGREFSLQDLLVLWDAIFAADDDGTFSITKYIVVAMLVLIRQQLLAGDYTACLTQLMKYPANVDINLVIAYAMHIRSPQTHPCPAGIQHSLPKALPMASAGRAAAHPTTSKSNGLSETGGDHMKAHLRTIQSTAAQAAMRLSAQQTGEQDIGIVQGFRENSPEAWHIELESSRAIISVTRLKLVQYLGVLRAHVPTGSAVDPLHQALDGIEELCSLLDIRPSTEFGPVDRAIEAVGSEPTADELRTRPKLRMPSVSSAAATNPEDLGFEVVSAADFTGHSSAMSIMASVASASDSLVASMQRTAGNIRQRTASVDYVIPEDQTPPRRVIGNLRTVEMREMRSPGSYTQQQQSAGASPVPAIDPVGERISPN